MNYIRSRKINIGKLAHDIIIRQPSIQPQEMSTYQSWINRINNLIQMLHDLPYWDTVTLKVTMKELIELKLIIETCASLAKEASFREEYFNEISEKQGHKTDDSGRAEAEGQAADRES